MWLNRYTEHRHMTEKQTKFQTLLFKCSRWQEEMLHQRFASFHCQVQVWKMWSGCLNAAELILNTWKPITPHKCPSVWDVLTLTCCSFRPAPPSSTSSVLAAALAANSRCGHADSPSLLPDTRARDVTHNNARGGLTEMLHTQKHE